jgi:NADPH-dependent ferric siderophore reductase
MTTVLERPTAFDSVLATVAAVEDLSPRLRRVTFVAPRIAEAVTAGPDQRIKVLLSPPNGAEIKLPSGPEWYVEWCAEPVESASSCGRTPCVRCAARSPSSTSNSSSMA